jgi:hypothetical protein
MHQCQRGRSGCIGKVNFIYLSLILPASIYFVRLFFHSNVFIYMICHKQTFLSAGCRLSLFHRVFPLLGTSFCDGVYMCVMCVCVCLVFCVIISHNMCQIYTVLHFDCVLATSGHGLGNACILS